MGAVGQRHNLVDLAFADVRRARMKVADDRELEPLERGRIQRHVVAHEPE